MAIAFFFAAIAFTLKWKSFNNWKYFIGIFICLWFSIASSLTYLLPSLLLSIYVGLLFVLKKDFRKQKVFFNSLILVSWIVAIIPFVRYSLRLKESDAFWWGNQGGLWESTGKSLSRFVFFTDAIWVLYLVTTLLLVCFVIFLNNWKKSGFWSYLKQTEAIVFYLFTGALIGFVLMRYVLNVNYPMDRVGMYLVPLFILFVGLFLAKNKILKYSLYGLLFLPFSFILNLNLSTSIFSPEDRIPTSLTNKIKTSLSDQTALSAEYVSHMSYAYSCRNDKKVHMAYTAGKEVQSYGDYHITWLGCDSINGYSIITQHPDSKTCFLQRNQVIRKKIIVDTLMSEIDLHDRYLTILNRPIDSLTRNGLIQVEISGEMKFDQPTSTFNFIPSTMNENKEMISRSSPPFSWYFSDRKDVNFVFTDQIIKLKPEETQFFFYLFNNDLRMINIKFLRVRIYQIID